MAPATRYFVMRLRRGGPLVAARLQWLDHASEDPPDNKLDRGRLSPYPVVDIAGTYTDPEILLDRIGVRRPKGDSGILPHEALAALADPDRLVPRPVDHWAHAQAVAEAEYRYLFDRMRWAERNRPDDPVLKPRRRVDPGQLALPNFDRENSL